MNREEIVAQRKLKVRALRIKKKSQKLESSVSVQAQTQPDFSLEQCAGDFPSLNTVGCMTRKYKFNANNVSEPGPSVNIRPSCVSTGIGSQNIEISKIDKSWKPKIKDPISIDIGQALQCKPEKSKVIFKKVDPTHQPSVKKGNILDSDNPQLKKGKVRPFKQRKCTKLKKHILSERNERRQKCCNDAEDKQSLELAIPPKKQTSLQNVIDKAVDDMFGELHCTDSSEDLCSLLSKFNLIGGNEKPISNECSSKINIVEEIGKNTPPKNIHSRKFREYCTNCLTEDVVSNTCILLEKLTFFQDRAHDRDPIRAQAKRRYVAGISQTKKYLLVKKVKLLVIAPDLERVAGEGGLDDIIAKFKSEADKQGVPYVFGPKRSRLGKSVLKKALVSCVAVLSFDGAEEQFSRVIESLEDAREKYQRLTHNDVVSETGEQSTLKKDITKPNNDKYVPAEALTCSFLALLQEEQAPRDILHSAISGFATGGAGP